MSNDNEPLILVMQHELIYTALGPSPLDVNTEKIRISIALGPDLKLIPSNLSPSENDTSIESRSVSPVHAMRK